MPDSCAKLTLPHPLIYTYLLNYHEMHFLGQIKGIGLLDSDYFTTTVRKEIVMPLFEVETDNHIIITWAQDNDDASAVVTEAYPNDSVLRMTKRPRDTWVISKSALGLSGSLDVCHTARDCLSKAEGDKVHAIRLYMHETGVDLEQARKVIESNMVMGW